MKSLLNKVSDKLKGDFYLFFQMFWPKISGDEYIESKHIVYICQELQVLGEKIIKREKPEFDWYLINVPPGSSKSSIASIMFPTWLITNDPSIFAINTSYSYELAVGFIRKAKLIFESKEYKAIFGELDLIKDLEYNFETKQLGGRFATSTGGTITGKHADVIISDDPLSVEESYSKVKIDKANRFTLQTLTTRKRNKSIVPIIVIMQRLNEDDVTGHLLSKNLNIKHICLPAELSDISSNPELYENGLLDNERMNKDILKEYKTVLGEYGYAGQFDQLPAPLEGGIFKKEWFEIVDKSVLPNHYIVDFYIDGAYTKNTANDPTGIIAVTYYLNTLYILNYVSKYLEMPELIKYSQNFVDANNGNHASVVKIEPKASGISLQQLLKSNTNLNPVLISGKHVSEGKSARSFACSPTIESGKVKLINGPWNEIFLNEVSIFPNGKHDEAVDCLCYPIYDKFIKIKRMAR